ncbi:hypothetical protein ACFL1H_07890, partial [Nanoarchaeota archaeon]
IFITKDHIIKFAFNKEFGEYDRNNETVKEIPLEDVMLNRTSKKDLSRIIKPSVTPRTTGRRRPRRPGSQLLKYAAVGKKE